MFGKIPVAATPLSLNMLSKSLFTARDAQDKLTKEFSSLIALKYLYFCNSGLSAFYLILKALDNKDAKKEEIILPAYTAPALVVAIKKAGQKVRLLDISLEDFNADFNLLDKTVNSDTLAILGIHMFGIVAPDIAVLKQKFPDIFIIEDCAQALGSKINDSSVGGLGDVSFFSFNKGKNISTYGGGSIATNSAGFSEDILKASKEFVKELPLCSKLALVFKNFGLSLAVRPFIYGLGYSLISLFKENRPPKDFVVEKYTNFQAAVALSLLERIEDFSQKRYNNGMALIEGLKDLDGIILPKIYENTQPAFNRLPVIIKDLEKRNIIEKLLWKEGIETSRLYLKPLHHIFDLGYSKEDFPNACYLAEHLLTLPVHPLVKDENAEKMVGIIRQILK